MDFIADDEVVEATPKNIRLRKRFLSTVVCLTGLSLTVFSAQTETLDRILAVVAGHVIMQSDVRAFVDLELAELGTDDDSDDVILTYLIERRLVLDEVGFSRLMSTL